MAKPQPIRGLVGGARLADAGRRILDGRLSDLTRWEESVPALEPAHAMRVASRRLRIALRLLGLRQLDEPVKELQDALGELRDRQLQAAWLASRDKPLQHQLAKELPLHEQQLDKALRRFRGKTLPRLLECGQKLEAPGKLGGRRVRKQLRKRIARFDLRLEVAVRSSKPRPMHRLRIAAKQLRYYCELLTGALPAAPPLLDELLPLQQSLGDLHDSDVRIQLLRHHGRNALMREEQAVRERLAALVEKELQRWQSRKVSHQARRALR
ncbi:MAG TPA: CHAD domain-containing protein [Myxococcales bacterium]|nr:CHAD domain-containing protein [Myxococcales bacterium]